MKNLRRILLVLIISFFLLGFPTIAYAETPPPDSEILTGDKLVVGDQFILTSDQVLNGSLVVLGGNVDIQKGAVVHGDIATLGGNINFAGTVNGTINAIGGNISLQPGAVIEGDITSVAGVITGIDNALVNGTVNTVSPQGWNFNLNQNSGSGALTSSGRSFNGLFSDIIAKIFGIFAMGILALVVTLVLPKPVNNVSKSIEEQPWLSVGSGLLAMVAFPLLVIILTITLILIPAMLVSVLVAVVAGILGWIAVGKYLGDRLAVLFKTDWADAVSAGLGSLIIGTVTWLLGYFFCLGGFLNLLAAAIGLGGVILSRFGYAAYPNLRQHTTVSPATTSVSNDIVPMPNIIEGESQEPSSPSDKNTTEPPQDQTA